MYYSIGGEVLFATTSEIIFMCLMWPVPPIGKFEICVEVDPRFHLSRNFHDRSHTSLPLLISLVGIPGYLVDNHHCDGCSDHNDDDV